LLISATQSVTVVDVTYTSKADILQQISVSACSGLFNRNIDIEGPAYLLWNQNDVDWLADTAGIVNPETTSISDFLKTCLSSSSISGYIRYNRTSQAEVVPNIITLAAMLNAIPLQDDDAALLDNSPALVFDALTAWDGFSSLNATKFVFDNYGEQTSTIAIMNPGYDQSVAQRHPFTPPLTGEPNAKLVDYIVKEKLFNFYFIEGCIRGSEEYLYLSSMLSDESTLWPKPVPVYGYNDAFPIAGDIFEAETDCNSLHNMGQIATSGTSNLAYFSRLSAVTEPTLQNPITNIEPYSNTKSYLSIVVGDGDNVAYLQGGRRNWMVDRVNRCLDNDDQDDDCFPLLWSLSPQITHLAPEWLSWYYEKSYLTQHDYFVLPPSGDLYSYPGEMPQDMQANYVSNTELDCTLYNTSATVHWEWFGTWTRAIDNFLPQYAKNGIVKGIFPVNVPFMFPMPEGSFGQGEHYRILETDGSDSKVVFFKPEEWRGTTCSSPFDICASASDLAAKISGFDLGSVSYLYVTSDGGADVDDIFDLVGALESHVQVVDHETLIEMAMERG
jgi:hypothetical protein